MNLRRAAAAAPAPQACYTDKVKYLLDDALHKLHKPCKYVIPIDCNECPRNSPPPGECGRRMEG